MALPAHLPFLLPFGWTTRVTVTKQVLARHRPLSPLAKPTGGNSPSAGKALASLPPSLHSLNEAGSLVLYWDNEGKMGHK